ncbi:MAG: hypothetical protein NC299_00895 [Lachnospiraceae bacterium]|nr:hypothetical protein [Ruminococcus sp.]MCM1273904.1 hypothetical protein [Lachnospiraceae bacterium]
MISTMKLPLKSAAKIRITEPISGIAEIRLRAGRPAVCVNILGDMRVCSEPFSAGELADCFAEICRYSVHSFQEDIARGFVTLDGGHRVGICGTAVTNGGRIEMFKDISGLNIRIAHEIKGCADEIFSRFFSGGLRSVLIAGKPLCGKTTVLRDLARRLGERHRVTLIDSRNELSASYHGTPTLDIGLNTDALCGCPKSEGIMLALRTLSPEVVICDEIGNDGSAVEQALFCGVKIIASAHAASLDELNRRPQTRGIAPFFDCCALIGERGRLLDYREKG